MKKKMKFNISGKFTVAFLVFALLMGSTFKLPLGRGALGHKSIINWKMKAASKVYVHFMCKLGYDINQP